MQIFLSSQEVHICARNLDDLRLNKQVIEACQIASTAAWKLDCAFGESLTAQKIAYLPTHEKHPLVLWASENYSNLTAIIHFGLACSDEYYKRFDKIHKTMKNLHNFWLKLLLRLDFDSKMIESINLMPNCTINHKHIQNTHKAYQQELILKWKNDKKPPKWTNRCVPEFWTDLPENRLSKFRYTCPRIF